MSPSSRARRPSPVAGVLLGALLGSFFPRIAAADIPGARADCIGRLTGQQVCETCVRDYSDPDAGTFDACQAAATAKGLATSCVERRSKVETFYLCPPGAMAPPAPPVPVGRGCGGCALPREASSLAGIGPLVIAVIAAGRRRRRR